MRVRISIPVAVWGRDFGAFLPGWWDAVEQMTRKPDEIVIGYENPDMAGAYDSIRRIAGVDIIGIVLEADGFTERWNEVMRACSGDWIAPVCVDDRVLPDALTEIQAAEDAGAELLVDGIVWKYRGDTWRGHWDAEAIGRVLTLPGAAPFRRSLFDRIGGFRPEIYSSDWAFYMDAAALGAKTYQASTLRIVFDEGNAHATRSGVQLDGATRSHADEQIRAYARHLGLV
jgi:hypothetical protein